MGNIHWKRRLTWILCVLALCWSCVLPASADGTQDQLEETAGATGPSLEQDDSPQSGDVPGVEGVSQPEDAPVVEEPSQPEDAPGEGEPSEPEETPGEEGSPEIPTVESYTVMLGD